MRGGSYGGGRGGDRGERGGYGGGRSSGGYGGSSDRGSSYGGSSGGSDYEKPVKEGEEYDVTVEAVGAKGDGVCKVNNFVVFVRGAQQGETVRVRVNKVFKRFAVAELVGGSTGTAAAPSEPATEPATEAASSDSESEETSEEEDGDGADEEEGSTE